MTDQRWVSSWFFRRCDGIFASCFHAAVAKSIASIDKGEREPPKIFNPKKRSSVGPALMFLYKVMKLECYGFNPYIKTFYLKNRNGMIVRSCAFSPHISLKHVIHSHVIFCLISMYYRDCRGPMIVNHLCFCFRWLFSVANNDWSILLLCSFSNS